MKTCIFCGKKGKVELMKQSDDQKKWSHTICLAVESMKLVYKRLADNQKKMDIMLNEFKV